MKIALAQINTKVGDITGNAAKIKKVMEKSSKLNIDLVIFPELTLTGYPPKDLLENKNFIAANLNELEKLATSVGKTACVIGYIDLNPSLKGKALLNSAALIHKGKITAKRHKSLLPEAIFDESKYFEPFAKNVPLEFKNHKVSITICEDILGMETLSKRQFYKNNPLRTFRKSSPDIIVNIATSVYCAGKNAQRIKTLSKLAKKTGAHIVYCNLVGANDELIFDGNSSIVDPKGTVIAQASAFKEDFVFADIKKPAPVKIGGPADKEQETIQAIALGIKDYFHKQGFKKAVLGLSGGMDSALVACLATQALGKENVRAVLMPSKYTSKQSVDDAKKLCKNLEIESTTIPINPIHKAYSDGVFAGNKDKSVSAAEQNIQARIRGNILMALANQNNWLVLATGNKSETAMGYCTLYGDTTGAIAPIADILKTDTYKLAARLNKDKALIPEEIIKRVPTAELKPNQTDQDDLPPYEQLDKIINAYIEENKTPFDIIHSGIGDKKTVFSVIKRMEANEHKRRQLPPSLKISKKSLGHDRKMPLVKDMAFAFKLKS